MHAERGADHVAVLVDDVLLGLIALEVGEVVSPLTG
jgi:hypothetical protein